ncbi:hypothetical protein EON65_33835 [archaeon]|nr:MAG: hypothetical protein EON65_33835 [archaeon]
MKEFLSIGLPFDRREFANIQRLTSGWNKAIALDDRTPTYLSRLENIDSPSPILLGYIRPNKNVASLEYQTE